MRAIGAAAVNQSMKAFIIARGYCATRGLNLALVAGFTPVSVHGEEKTAITMRVVNTP